MRMESVAGLRLTANQAVEAFLSQFDRVAAAYEYDWHSQESFTRRAAYLNGGGYRGNRKAVAAALQRYNEALGAGSATLEQIGLLAQEESLAVVTGQQAGIFAGPAYSVYKAMTAIRLARTQSERLRVPVVPVFWIAAEDHDWLEVSSVTVPAGDSIAKLTLKESFAGDRRSVGLAPAPGSLAELLTEFESLLPETEFKAGIVERIRDTLSAGPALDPALSDGQPTLVDWFGRLMTWMFEGTGLVILNPADPALRRLEAPFFAQAVRRHEALDEALERGYERWGSLGFEPTLDRQPGNLNLFTYVDGERLPLVGAGEQFWVRDREEIGWSSDELLSRVEQHPELFSTNVVLRPVIQGFLLPDLAYVGGPGEISYFGLYRDVYTVLEQQMPILYPRASFTLVEPPIARILEKQELSLLDVFHNLDAKRQELLEREDRLGIVALFERFRSDFGGEYEQLVEQIMQLDPTLRFVAEENRKQIAVQINKLEEKARQQHRKNCEVALRQFERLKAHLAPAGPQERSVSILPYLAKYGPDLVRRMLDEAPVADDWGHWAIYLGG